MKTTIKTGLIFCALYLLIAGSILAYGYSYTEPKSSFVLKQIAVMPVILLLDGISGLGAWTKHEFFNSWLTLFALNGILAFLVGAIFGGLSALGSQSPREPN